jgi:hypothetical protein
MYKRQHPDAGFTVEVAPPVEMNSFEAHEVDDERDIAALLRP